MIFFKMRIANPWFKPDDDFEGKDFYWRDSKISKNKNFEIQISKFQATDLIDVGIDLRWWGSDHQGPELDLNLFGYMFNVKIYDSRHWNHDTGRWYTEEEARVEYDGWQKEKGA